MDAATKSWKTTAIGVLTVVVGLGKIALDWLQGEPITGEDIGLILALLGVGGIATVAKDGDQK